MAALGYTVFNPVSAGIYRVSGTARVGAASLPWSAVLKICRAPTEAELAAPDDRREILMDTLRWDREAEAYASGLLETLPRGLAAPRCLGVDRHDRTLWIWLEDIGDDAATWDVARYALAARHLGRLGGEYLAGRELPIHLALTRVDPLVELRTSVARCLRSSTTTPYGRSRWSLNSSIRARGKICGRCCASATGGRERSIAFR